MKLHLFNRDKRKGNFSIEQLFYFLSLEFSKKINVSVYQYPGKKNILYALFWAYRNRGQINHISGDVHYLALGLPKKNTILTIHDIGYYEYGLSGIKKLIYKYLWLIGPINRVNKITTISEYSKMQLVSKLGVNPDKVVVIYNPLLPFFSFRPKVKKNDKPVILQIGSGKNKNVKSLILSVIGLNVKLLLLNNFSDPELLQLLKYNNIDFEQRLNLNTSELVNTYYESDILYFASFYEGFGMPIIESQAIGRPVITSNISCMPEIAGKAAIFVSPNDIFEIRKAILNLLSDENLYARLVNLGKENVTRFELNRVVDSYISLYQNIK